jgi:hypothetical protein
VLVVTRHRVDGEGAEQARAAEAVLEVLARRPGFVRGTVGRAADDPDLVALVTEWESVGTWRRALSPVDVRVAVLPFLATAIDEPTAYLTSVDLPAE